MFTQDATGKCVWERWIHWCLFYTQKVCKQKMWHVIKQENLVISFATTSHKLFWQTNKLYEAAVEKKKREKNTGFESYSHTKGKTQKKTSIMGIIISVAMETSLQTQYLHVSTAYYHLVWLYIIETIVITFLGWKNACCHGNTVQCS